MSTATRRRILEQAGLLMVSAGVPLAEVRDLLGHTTVKMTERYAHLAPENVRVAVSVLEGSVSRSRHVGNTEQLQEVG